ncbi:hypothetical protein [Leyella stercorea]|uniref:hypothetical protein n=1 Tax=Leyella stercorea TaxID=363265 RepID=UPI001A38813E|nr:hypothetical protein [Leyella stercorea]MBL6518080.1 hypothetical protein [Leyella stercorea]
MQRRHGIVEFETTMHHLRRFIKPDSFLLDIGAGTGRYTSALMSEGYQAQADELYDYVRIDDINRLDERAGLKRVTIFSPDGASNYMRTCLNRMSDETFARFIEYQKCISERADLIGTGSHVVDVVRVP